MSIFKRLVVLLTPLLLVSCGSQSVEKNESGMKKYEVALNTKNYLDYFDITVPKEGMRGSVAVKGTLSYAQYKDCIITFACGTGSGDGYKETKLILNLSGNGNLSADELGGYYRGVTYVSGEVSYWF